MIRGLVRSVLFATFVAAGTSAGASAGHTDVTISTAPTHDMALANGVYSPTGNKAVLNVNDLTTALNAGNLEVTTGSADGKESGDIVVEAAFHWASGYALTLDAFHSIRVDAPLTDAGAGALTLSTNDGGKNGHLQFGSAGNIGFWGLTNALTINGQAYTLVNSVASLAAAITANPSGNYALAASYDASVDHTYRQDPIATTFEGNFEGLGNAVSNISIRTGGGNYEGFFSEIATGASVSNFRLRNATITESNNPPYAMGGLVGYSFGTLYGDDVSGTMTVIYTIGAGGLVGVGKGTITQCSSSVSVRWDREGDGPGFVGGLAGDFVGTVSDSVASQNVVAGDATIATGGLVGWATGSIRHSHATGNVSGPFSLNVTYEGGLVGNAAANISDSYATGNVQGGKMIGGLVGLQSASISASFANGRVRGNPEFTFYAGGLAGWLQADGVPSVTPSISNSYATGTVSGAGWAGGVFGQSPLTGTLFQVVSSYATGKSTGEHGAGGFAGVGCCFSEDYWDISTSGMTNGVGAGIGSGITGLTSTQLRAGLPAGFDPDIWAEDRKINHGLPYLIANPPPQ